MEGPRRTRRTGRGQCRLGEQGLGLPWGSHMCQPFKHQQAGVHRGQSGLSSWSALPHAEARVTWLTVTSGENRAARSSCPARSRQGRGGREESPLKQTVAFRLRTGSGLELLVLEAASGGHAALDLRAGPHTHSNASISDEDVEARGLTSWDLGRPWAMRQSHRWTSELCHQHRGLEYSSDL